MPIITEIAEVRKELYEQVKEEKTQEMVAKKFEEIKDKYRVDNYTLNTTTGGASGEKGIRQTSATKSTAPARPAEVTPRNASGARNQPK